MTPGGEFRRRRARSAARPARTGGHGGQHGRFLMQADAVGVRSKLEQPHGKVLLPAAARRHMRDSVNSVIGFSVWSSLSGNGH